MPLTDGGDGNTVRASVGGGREADGRDIAIGPVRYAISFTGGHRHI